MFKNYQAVLSGENKITRRKVLVTGAGGYVGARLVPSLISNGYEVVAVDTYWYGREVLDRIPKEALFIEELDIRDVPALTEAMNDVTDVIHLACISNDPSFDLNPELGKSINLDAFEPLVQVARNAGVRRFIYASSSSVYGVKEEERVTEELSLEPLTDYSKFKAICEEINRMTFYALCFARPRFVDGPHGKDSICQ